MKKPQLRKAVHSGELPLSLEQEELWHTWPLPPESIAYNHPLVLWIDGPFDRAAWDKALALLVRRHDALRTRFRRDEAGEVRQVVGEAFEPDITWHDVSTLETYEQLVKEAIESPFDLTDGPLLRGVGARLGDDLHGVVLVFHRATVDCWASGVLERELVAAYEGRELPETGIQYPDYTLWQRELWESPERDRLLGYWRTVLKDSRPLKLPTDREPAEEFDAVGDIVQWRLPPPFAPALIELARQEKTSPFVVLAAGYAAMLGEWTGETDVLVATTLGGRTVSSLSSVVGLFANTVFIRSDLDSAPTFRGLLATTRRNVIGAFSYQQAPFGQVVADVAPVRDSRRPPLANVLLSHQEFVDPATLAPRPPGPVRAGYRDMEGGMREARRRAAQSTLFDLELHTIVNNGMVAGLFEYRSQLFDKATIEELTTRWVSTLGRLVTEPDAPLRG
jgi:hypothetical protein